MKIRETVKGYWPPPEPRMSPEQIRQTLIKLLTDADELTYAIRDLQRQIHEHHWPALKDVTDTLYFTEADLKHVITGLQNAEKIAQETHHD